MVDRSRQPGRKGIGPSTMKSKKVKKFCNKYVLRIVQKCVDFTDIVSVFKASNDVILTRYASITNYCGFFTSQNNFFRIKALKEITNPLHLQNLSVLPMQLLEKI